MRIAFVVALFPPEIAPSATMASQLSEHWGASGHEVTVVCPFPNRPYGKVHAGFTRSPVARSHEFGARVLRVWTSLIDERRSAASRVLENLTFGVSSSIALLLIGRPDVVVAEAWPILAYLPIVAAARLRRVPLVNYVKDVYPEAAEAAGLLEPGSALSGALLRLDAWVCRAAARNITISENMSRLLADTRGLGAEKLFIIRDWLDLSSVKPHEGESSWRREHGIGSEFVCMYSGTLGHASGADVLVDVAEQLREEPDVRIVCVGEGVLKARMREQVASRGLANMTLLPFQPQERVSEAQSSADVMLLTASPAMGASSIPSKLITYLAVGKPVVCAIAKGSDIAELVESRNLGVVVEPNSAAAIARGIQYLRGVGAKAREEMGRRARATAVSRYSLEAATRRFDELFASMGLLDLKGGEHASPTALRAAASRPRIHAMPKQTSPP